MGKLRRDLTVAMAGHARGSFQSACSSSLPVLCRSTII